MNHDVKTEVSQCVYGAHYTSIYSSTVRSLRANCDRLLRLRQLITIVLIMGPTCALAQPAPSSSTEWIKADKSHVAKSSALQRLSDEIDQTLRAQASSANVWWGSWIGIFTGFAVLNGTRAILRDGNQPSEGLSTPALWTNGIKALLGTANLLVRTHSPRHAAQNRARGLG